MPQLPLFWAINIVPMAIVFYHAGYLCRNISYNNYTYIYISAFFLITILLLDSYGVISHSFIMKWQKYGVAVINCIVALSCIYLTLVVAEYSMKIKFISTILQEVGQASITIMFLHQALKQILSSHINFLSNNWILLAAVIFVCYFFHFILKKRVFSRRVFLGII